MGQVSLASPDLDFRSGHFVEVRGFQVKCYTDPSLLAGHLSGQCRKERTWNTMKMGTTLGSRSLAWKSLSIHSYGTFQPAGTAGRLATVSPKLCLVSLTRPGIAILAPSSSSYILAKHEARHSQRGPGRTDGAKLPPLEDGGMEKGECVSRHLKSEGLMPKTILCSSSTSPQDAPRETFSSFGTWRAALRTRAGAAPGTPTRYCPVRSDTGSSGSRHLRNSERGGKYQLQRDEHHTEGFSQTRKHPWTLRPLLDCAVLKAAHVAILTRNITIIIEMCHTVCVILRFNMAALCKILVARPRNLGGSLIALNIISLIINSIIIINIMARDMIINNISITDSTCQQHTESTAMRFSAPLQRRR